MFNLLNEQNKPLIYAQRNNTIVKNSLLIMIRFRLKNGFIDEEISIIW